MKLPDFLIVGTGKSGTSSLANYLSLHPNIYIPSMEIRFFDKNSNYKKGIEWYQSFFSKEKNSKLSEKGYEWYLRLFKQSKENFFLHNKKKLKNQKSKLIIGEKSPTYCLSPLVAKRIASDLPNVKLIWIFRNPVHRAYSHYLYNYSHGAIRLSFEEVVKLGDKSKQYHLGVQNCDYLRIGVYSEHIKKYLNFFDKSNMIFLLFENLIEKPRVTLDKTFKFLGIDNNFKISKNIKMNITTFPKNNYLLWSLRSIYNKVKLVLGNQWIFYFFYATLYIFLEQLVIKNQLKQPKMKDETKQQLYQFYKPYNKELAKFTGLNLEKWNNNS